MLEGIKILIERIEANDKDIDDWIDMAQEVICDVDEDSGEDDQFTEEEKKAVRAAIVNHRRRDFNATVLKKISGQDGDDEEESKKGGPLTRKIILNQAQLQLMKAMEAQAKREGGPVQW